MAEFATCRIDGKTRAEITALYPKRKDLATYLMKFDRYLQDRHGMTIKEYVIRFGGIVWPKCPVSDEDVAYDFSRSVGLVLRKYKNGVFARSKDPRLLANWDRMKETRRGKNSPVFGKPAWNRGRTAADTPGVARIAKAQRGAKRPPEAIENMKRGWAKTTHRARRTGPHSEETKNTLRLRTAEAWAKGCFSHKTSIHIAMREFLKTLSLTEPVKEECQDMYFVIDFAFPKARLGIECDGDYFHCNPQFYPNGPKHELQRRCIIRDAEKKAFLEKRGWTIIHFWECEINAGSFKEPLQCKLRELGLLSPSVASAA